MSVRVQFVLTDDEYEILKKNVREKGISISKYVKDRIFSETGDGHESFENIWGEFCERVKVFPSNVECTVATIMTQERWQALERSEKLSIARLFNKSVAKREFPDIELVGRSSSNVNIYKKHD